MTSMSGGISIDVKAEHSQKALLPRWVRPALSLMLFKPLHLQKTLLPKLCSPDCRVMLLKRLHSRKAQSDISVTLSGKTMLFKFAQP